MRVLMIVGAVALVAGGFVALKLLDGSDPSKPQLMTLTELEAELAAGEPELFELIRRHFPEDYSAAIAELESTLAFGRPEETLLMQETAKLVASIRMRHGAAIRFAPEADLRRYIETYAALLEALELHQGPVACARIAVEGGLDLAGTQIPEDLLAAFETHSLAAFGAIAVGRSAEAEGTVVERPRDADWPLIGPALIAQGFTAAEIEALNLAPDDPASCPNLRRYLAALLSIEGAAGRRLISEFATDLAVGG